MCYHQEVVTRYLYLRPEHPRLPWIQDLRRRYDPLAEKVPPHLTVVFPFPDPRSPTRLVSLLNEFLPTRTFSFSLSGPVRDGEYLYFPVDEGKEMLAILHDALYEALPPGLLSPGRPYVPHLTFGRCRTPEEGDRILRELRRFDREGEGEIVGAVIGHLEEPDGAELIEYEKKLKFRSS